MPGYTPLHSWWYLLIWKSRIGQNAYSHCGQKDCKELIREVAAGSSQIGQNMLTLHFGLGRTLYADSVTVYWPSGKVQVFEDVEANQRVTITEPK